MNAPSTYSNFPIASGPFDVISGLPVHPLVVHAAVVLLPLAALGLCAVVLVPRLRPALGWLVVAGLWVALGATFVAKESGEKLASRVGDPGVHAELGDILPLFTLVLALVGTGWFLLQRREFEPKLVVRSLGLLALVVALLNVGWVIRVGHTGATETWGSKISSTTPAGGDE